MIAISDVKLMFFDDRTLREINRKAGRGIVRVAANTRTIARRSIRKAGKSPRTLQSRPGQPPRSHTGLLRQHIYFWYDRRTQSAEIGPARLGGTQGMDIPGNLEEGRKGIRPRPYMGPALEKSKDQLKDLLT